MNSAKTEFRRTLQLAKESDRLLLRLAAKVMERNRLPPGRLVSKGPDWIERELVKLRVKNPAAFARRIPQAIDRLANLAPNAGLPSTQEGDDAPSRRRLLRRREEPRAFRQQIVAFWVAERRRRCGRVRSRGLITSLGHIWRVRAFVATALRARVDLSGEADLEELSIPEYVRLTMLHLTGDLEEGGEGRSLSYASVMVGSLFILARDALGPAHPHVKELTRYRAKEIKVIRGLGAKSLAKLEEVLASGGLKKLLALPDVIAARADEDGIGPKDSAARHQYAFLLALKIDHMGLTETQGVELDLERDIVEENGRYYLELRPVAAGRKPIREPMAEANVVRLKNLRALRATRGVKTTLLFPPRGGTTAADADGTAASVRETAPVLTGLADEMALHFQPRLTFGQIQDLLVLTCLRQGVTPFIVARRAGYAHTRSLETRFAGCVGPIVLAGEAA